MYGKLNERKINESDYIMSCQKAREELTHYINEQAKRVNVDSAKKRAVVQHMDYEGFRQMVLGANIFPTKSKQLYTLTKGQPSMDGAIFKEQDNKDKEKPIKKTQQTITLQKIQGKSEMHCNSFREFKKKFNENYPKEFDITKTLYCYNLLKQQNEERLRKIFNMECEGNILVKVVAIFEQVLTQMSNNKTSGIEQQAGFMLIFFKTILSIPTMKSMTLSILSKKQKQSLFNFLSKLKTYFSSQQQLTSIQQLSKNFSK